MPKPLLIFAHRGAKDQAPENTLSAFTKAMQLGADGVETDVLVTSDDVPVLCHNNELKILTTHSGRIHQMTCAALKDIDVGSHFGPSWSYERIPTLQATLELFSGSNLKVVLEVKKQAISRAKAVAAIAKIVRPYLSKVDLMFSSFSSLLLWELKKQLPHIPRAALYETRLGLHYLSYLEAPWLQIRAITPFHEHVSTKFVHWAKTQQLPLYAWTVNTPKAMQRMQALGVDGIMTDHVELAKKVFHV